MGCGGAGLGSVVRKRLHALGIQWERSKTWEGVLGNSGVANSLVGADWTFWRAFYSHWSSFVPCPEAPPGHCCWERKLGFCVTFRMPVNTLRRAQIPFHFTGQHTSPQDGFSFKVWLEVGLDAGWEHGIPSWSSSRTGSCTQFPKSTTVAPH